MHLSYVPSDVIRNKTLQKFPQLAPVLESEAVFGYDIEANPMLLYFFIVVVVFIFLGIPFIQIGSILTILYRLKQMKSIFSQRTYKLHLNLLLALSVQIFLPQFMILIPDVILVFGAWKKWSNTNIIAETNLMLCTFHSVFDNFAMMLIIAPYRKALSRILKKSIFGKYEIHITIHKKEATVADINTHSVQNSNSTYSNSHRRQTASSVHY
ncbi:hypothetical protein FO519_010117 [Halicephalobus sp. NKZ332]|nr:hypothetical protein FO519_010117 [Halicephalobus sp. NKZ332]